MVEASLNTNISVPGKQRRRVVAKGVRKFVVKDSQRKTALPTPATITKRSRKGILFRIFAVGTSLFILLAMFALWTDKSFRRTTLTENRQSMKKLRFSLPSHADAEETGVGSNEQTFSEDSAENKDAAVLDESQDTREDSEPRPHQNSGAQSIPEQAPETLDSFKDLTSKNPDQDVSERPIAKNVAEKAEPISNFLEWYTRDDYKVGMRPICRISNPIVLSNGTILIPESMRAHDKVLRNCGLGVYSFYPSSGPAGVNHMIDVGVDFALTIHLERFQEPTHVTSVYLTEHILKSSFLFDTFEGNTRLTEGVKQIHCKATETGEDCSHTRPQKSALRPGIFVPRRIERTVDSSWPRMFVEMFGKAYGHGNDAVHLNASSILIKSHAKHSTDLVGTRFRSILSTDGMFRHLPLGALQDSSFFSRKSGSNRKAHDGKKGDKCSLTIGISKSSDPVSGFESSSELKQKLAVLSKFAAIAQLNVKELETSAVTEFHEYIEQMRHIDIFVAGSGEDMTTIGFLSPGSAVFELMPFGINPDVHGNLARSLNLGYKAIKGKPKDESFKQCIALEIFSLRKKGKLKFSENPNWQEPVMKAWEAAVAEFVISGTSSFDILTSEEPVKNYYSKRCALRQKIEIGVEDATRQILQAAKEICNTR